MLQISEGGYTALGKNTLVKRLLDERQKAKGKRQISNVHQWKQEESQAGSIIIILLLSKRAGVLSGEPTFDCNTCPCVFFCVIFALHVT